MTEQLNSEAVSDAMIEAGLREANKTEGLFVSRIYLAMRAARPVNGLGNLAFVLGDLHALAGVLEVEGRDGDAKMIYGAVTAIEATRPPSVDGNEVETLARKFIVPLGYAPDVDWERTWVGNQGDNIETGSLAYLCRSLARAALTDTTMKE